MFNCGFFIVFQDSSECLQVYVNCKILLEEILVEIKIWDLGDIIGVEGVLVCLGKGDLYVDMISVCLLIKLLCLLLDKYYGLIDIEQCYCQCYVDLMVNEEICYIFCVCFQVIVYICCFFSECGFFEVEILMLQIIFGGVVVKLFEIYYNVLDMVMFLCIVLELYFKCLVVGGFEKVFEINCNFCNEGVLIWYNFEFIMFEFYQVYVDYEDNMDLIEELFCELVQVVFGIIDVFYGDKVFYFGELFVCLLVFDLIFKYNLEIIVVDFNDVEKVWVIVKKVGVKVFGYEGLGKLQVMIFEELVEYKLEQLYFIICYFFEVLLLVCCNDEDLSVIDCFELFIGGCEIVNVYFELNDVEDQVECFMLQVKEKDVGDDEVMYYDVDFINVLEYGMLLIVGEGIGIDCLVMLLINLLLICDVILFLYMCLQV